MPSSSRSTPRRREAPWRARSLRRRNAASNDPPAPEEWPGLLGRRVSIRYRLQGDPGYPFSEAIGVIQAVRAGAGGDLRADIVNRRGETTTVAIDDVLALKLL